MFIIQDNYIYKHNQFDTGRQTAEELSYYGFIKPAEYILQSCESIEIIEIDEIQYEVVIPNLS